MRDKDGRVLVNAHVLGELDITPKNLDTAQVDPLRFPAADQ